MSGYEADAECECEYKDRCRKLEATLRKYYKLNKELKAEIEVWRSDNAELARKCKEHYTKCQQLMRYEFKLQDVREKHTHGTVTGTKVDFTL